MITFFKNQLAALRQVTVGNPLFFYQLRRFSVYTWLNLAALFAVALVVSCTAARLSHYLTARSWAAEYSAAMEMEFTVEKLHESYTGTPWIHLGIYSRLGEFAYFCGQFGGMLLLYLVLILGAYKNIHFLSKSSWDHPQSPHIRLLPISSSQVQFALIDLRFFAVSLCILCCGFLLWLPAIDVIEVIWGEEIHFMRYYSCAALAFWILSFIAYRTKQFQQPYGNRIWKNPMFGAWIAATLFSLITPLALRHPLGALLQINYMDALNILFWLSNIISLLFLLVSCWLKKYRLLKQYVEE